MYSLGRRYWHRAKGGFSTRVPLLPSAICPILTDVRNSVPKDSSVWKLLAPWQSLRHHEVLDELRLPLEQELLMRMLRYDEMRSQTERRSGTPTKVNAAQFATAAHRRKQ